MYLDDLRGTQGGGSVLSFAEVPKPFAITPTNVKDNFEMEVEQFTALKQYYSNQSIVVPNDISNSFQTPAQQQIQISKRMLGGYGSDG